MKKIKMIQTQSPLGLERELSKEEFEMTILESLGLPTNIRSLKLGEAVYLLQRLSGFKDSLPEQGMIEIAKFRGYSWREENTMKSLSPQLSLYLDGFVRLNEIYDKLNTHLLSISHINSTRNL